MKVLILSRKDIFLKKGGDTIQIENICSNLIEKNIEVSLKVSKDSNEKYDVAHIFNSYNVDETLQNIEIAKKRAKITVLTPIYHSEFSLREMIKEKIDFKKYLFSQFFSYEGFMTINNIIKQINLKNYYVFKNFFTGYKKKQQKIFNEVDLIMPNSNREQESILEEVSLKQNSKFKVVFNGVNTETLNNNLYDNTKFDVEPKGYLICIGRIEPLKNQISVIQGFKNTEFYKKGYSLVFCGAPNNFKYFNDFIREIDKDQQLKYYGQLDQKQLFPLLRASAGLIHASWFETTGLIGLEAGMFEVPVVMTNKGYTKSYFKNNVVYCNPKDTESIRYAIDSIIDISQMQIKQLKEDIINQYNWNTVTNEIIKGYDSFVSIGIKDE